MTARLSSVLSVLALLVASFVVGQTASTAAEARAEGTGWCTARQWGTPREIPHLKRQQRVVKRVLKAKDRAYVVKRARATHFGVIALVAGNVKKARRELRGVDHVVSWTRGVVGTFPPRWRMEEAVFHFLEPVLPNVLRKVRGIPGRGEPAYWTRGGAVVLEWKAPVPAAVQKLAGVRPSGVEVRVVARPYSAADIQRGMEDVFDFLEERDVPVSMASSCESAAGIELGVPFDVDDLPVTQAELEEAAGMRVLVVEQGYAQPV